MKHIALLSGFIKPGWFPVYVYQVYKIEELPFSYQKMKYVAVYIVYCTNIHVKDIQ